MAEWRPPRHLHPAKKRHTVANAAAAGQLVILHCSLCKRTCRYLASDLARIVDPSKDAYRHPFDCAKCWTGDYVRVILKMPRLGGYGALLIRRSGPVKHIEAWRNFRLGD